MIKNILFLLVVFLTNIIQCITGFAGTVAADYPGGLPMTFNEENKPDCFIHHFSELLDLFPGEGKYLPERGERRD